MSSKQRPQRLHWILLVVVALVFVWSAIRPLERFTWFMEVFPVILGVMILGAVFPRFRFTPLLYVLMAIHMVILMVGGRYTYAEVPLGNWIRDAFDMSRNHYDRLGHFAQGFVPALIAREVLLRRSPLQRGKWLFFIIVSICLAFSAFYELIEWTAAVSAGSAADAFLGTQGDVWDTQKDMALALIGAITALLTLSRFHDRQLGRLEEHPVAGF